MYHPPPSGIEYVELKNISGGDVSLYDSSLASAWRFTNGISYSFTNGYVIPSGGYALIVASTPGLFRSTYNVPANVPVFGPFSGLLDNGGEKLELSKPGGLDSNTGAATWIMVDRVNYNNAAPWPTTPNGSGPSLSRYLLNGYTNDAVNWIASNPAPTPAPNAIILSGQSGADNYYLRPGPNNTSQLYRNDPTFTGPPDFVFPRDGLDQLIINAGGGNDTLTIDLPSGVGLPASGLLFNGDVGDDAINILSPTSSANPLQINVGSGSNTLNFQNGQGIGLLTIPPSGQLNLPAGGKVLKVSKLSVGGGATLNLSDNDLIVQADSATWQSVFNSITALVASGRNGGGSIWNGTGINCSTAAANALRSTGLAAIANRTSGGTASSAPSTAKASMRTRFSSNTHTMAMPTSMAGSTPMIMPPSTPVLPAAPAATPMAISTTAAGRRTQMTISSSIRPFRIRLVFSPPRPIRSRRGGRQHSKQAKSPFPAASSASTSPPRGTY